MNDHVSTEQLSALIDGQLSLVSREAVIDHLRHCPSCASSHDALVEFAAVMTAVPAERWSAQLTEQVIRQIVVWDALPREPRHQRDLSLPVAALIAAAGALAVLLVAPSSFASGFDGLRLNPFAALAADLGIPVSGFLFVLLLLPAVGVFAVPLIRER